MRKFKFKLKTPLKIKQMKEKIKKQKLATAIIRQNYEKKQLKTLLLQKVDLDSALQKNLKSFIKVEELYAHKNFLQDLNKQIKHQKKSVSKAKKEYLKSRLSFIETRKERQILEKLKQKSFTLYMDEINREEQKVSDEIAISNYCRREVESDYGY